MDFQEFRKSRTARWKRSDVKWDVIGQKNSNLALLSKTGWYSQNSLKGHLFLSMTSPFTSREKSLSCRNDSLKKKRMDDFSLLLRGIPFVFSVIGVIGIYEMEKRGISQLWYLFVSRWNDGLLGESHRIPVDKKEN